MQNKYVGDIGDYAKLAILRSLAPRHKMGVAWWLHPDEPDKNNGRHTKYLNEPVKWRHFDPDLFDFLRNVATSDGRSVLNLEQAPLLGNVSFHNKPLLIEASPEGRRRHRAEWFEEVKAALAGSEIIFVDPDNGLEPNRFSPGSKAGAKSVSLAELRELDQPGRALIIYHHQTRRKGGHKEELMFWAEQLKKAGFETIDAIRAGKYSARVFFFLNATPIIRENTYRLVRHWHPHLEWFPHQTPATSLH